MATRRGLATSLRRAMAPAQIPASPVANVSVTDSTLVEAASSWVRRLLGRAG
ncbi:MAG: hypothetical protein U0667_15960 [Chloroflexota bacterium]